MHHMYRMFTIILKKIIYFKNKQSLDSRLWIQRSLLNKKFRYNSL